MNRILAWLFPVRLPSLHHTTVRETNPVEEIPEAGIGVPKKKKYRDGIERFLAEQRRALNERQANSPDYLLEYFGSQR